MFLTDTRSGAEDFNRVDQHLAWTVDPGRPDVSPPSAPGPRNVTLDEARFIGVDLGIADAQVLADATAGDGQVFLLGNEQRSGTVIFVGGDVLETGEGERDETVGAHTVTDENLDVGYLVVTVTDPRVAAIDIDLAFVPDRSLEMSSVPAAFIFEVEPRARVNRFVAFDAQGNELGDINAPD